MYIFLFRKTKDDTKFKNFETVFKIISNSGLFCEIIRKMEAWRHTQHTYTIEILNNIIKCYMLFVHMDSKINCPILLTFDIVFICIYWIYNVYTYACVYIYTYIYVHIHILKQFYSWKIHFKQYL